MKGVGWQEGGKLAGRGQAGGSGQAGRKGSG